MKSISQMTLVQLVKTKAQIEAEIISRIGKSAVKRQAKKRSPAPGFRNPKNPEETWVGRGRRPFWLSAALRRGKKLSDFALH
jgi:DNA-binding protein H-NS